MPRTANTRADGAPFDEATIDRVWLKGNPAPGGFAFRLDRCKAMIYRNDYGKTSQHGWEIDHITPVAHRGTDDLGNLQPLHWENNRAKADTVGPWNCKRTA